jgi:heat-inducible transcriptional repressor
VKIGSELGSEEITECSVVTVPYHFGEGVVGMLAILGPRRMPYARLLSIATGTAESLNSHFTDSEIR